MREYDVTVGCENVFAELLDLQASESLDHEVRAHEIVELIQERYDALWSELTGEEEFAAGEMWRIEQRIEHLNDLGFDVEEIDIVTDFDGDRVQIQPKVVELGHHQRELQALTGMNVEDAQARRLLNDLAAFTAHYDLGGEDRTLVANRWLTEIYEPIIAMVPPEARGKLEPAEIFHEILVHRWLLSERAGHEVDIFDDRPRLHRHRAHPPARRGGRRADGVSAARLSGRQRSRSRPITIRWIWLVPSKIWVTLASRNSRSTGYSRV